MRYVGLTSLHVDFVALAEAKFVTVGVEVYDLEMIKTLNNTYS